MNSSRIMITKLCFALALLASATAIAQEREDLLALAHWRVTGKQGHLLCSVRKVVSSTMLTIDREEGAKLTRIFNFETPDSLLNIYPLGEYNGRLITTWVGGSAYHLRAWAFVDGQVKQVLDEGTKMVPEFLYDDQGRESVLITDPAMENGKWTTANGTTAVFKWNGERYEKIGTVPWPKRLQCLSKESCASLK